MNILLVDLETEWRGGQNQALLMLKGFHARQHKAELVAAEGSILGERAAADGITVHSVPRHTLRISAALKIRNLARTSRFDLVHANESHGVTSAWLARAHRHLPFVISRRVGFPVGRSRLAKARYLAASRIVAISQWVAEQLTARGIPKEKISIVYEGVEIPRLPSSETRRQARAAWGISGDAPLLGCAGALLPDKGQDLLIRALAQVHPQFPEAKVLLAGDGPDRPRLEQLAKEQGVRKAVVFAGFVSEMEQFYSALDLFVFPSLFEGLGTSLLAAMSYQIPSIAFNCCAFGEIIENNKSGLLADRANIQALSAAILRVLRDPLGAIKMATSARTRIESVFSAQKMVDEMLRVYEALRPSRS
jgi:glycosyltransferase involved in cell wall biosynthesis